MIMHRFKNYKINSKLKYKYNDNFILFFDMK